MTYNVTEYIISPGIEPGFDEDVGEFRKPLQTRKEWQNISIMRAFMSKNYQASGRVVQQQKASKSYLASSGDGVIATSAPIGLSMDGTEGGDKLDNDS